MLKWLKKLFFKPPPPPEEEIDPSLPCWRCNQVIETGPRASHKCQHGKECVMLGWRCVWCREEASVRLGFRECLHLRCKDKCLEK